jgi:hypothetical protein
MLVTGSGHWMKPIIDGTADRPSSSMVAHIILWASKTNPQHLLPRRLPGIIVPSPDC